VFASNVEVFICFASLSLSPAIHFYFFFPSREEMVMAYFERAFNESFFSTKKENNEFQTKEFLLIDFKRTIQCSNLKLF